MRQVLKALAVIIVALNCKIGSAKMGGQDGNGGGGIVFEGEVKTYAQMGGKFENGATGIYMIPMPAFDEIFNILKVIAPLAKGFNIDFSHAIFSREHVYFKEKEPNPEMLSRVSSDYRPFLNRLSLSGDFKLLAYTQGRFTTVFDEFERLDPRTQALVLFHEAAIYLAPQADLHLVLQFEVALYALTTGNYTEVDVWHFMKSLVDLGLTTEAKAQQEFGKYRATQPRSCNSFLISF